MYYYGDSNCTNRRRKIDISQAENTTGQDLFSVWGIANNDYAEEESKVPVTVRQYTKRDLYPEAVLEALVLITYICDCIWNKRHMKREAFSLKTLYNIIHVLPVQEHLKLLSEGGMK